MFLFFTFILILAAEGEILNVPSINNHEIRGKLGFVGDFAGISFVKDTRQFDSPSSLLLQDKGIFLEFDRLEGQTNAVCILQNTIYVGGRFPKYIAQYNIDTDQWTSLGQGLDGPVLSLYCDPIDNRVYVGGQFTAPVDRDASFYGGYVAQWHNQTWSPLPWKGFNGPVHTIARNHQRNTLLFGGEFDSTVSTVKDNARMDDQSMIPMDSPFTIISDGNGAHSSNSKSIVCRNEKSNWFLKPNVPGYWEANFAHPVQPTLFRLSNVHDRKRGTTSFNILALGSNQYFNLSYFEPNTHQVVQCSIDCLLSNETFQNFTVLDPIVTSGIRININSWFGKGGGLGYVQMYQSDVSLYPSTRNSLCQEESSKTIVTGNWKEVYVYGYYQTVLESKMNFFKQSIINTSIIYQSNIPSYDQYEIYTTTPGCVGSSNCHKRAKVEYLLQLQPNQTSTVYLDQNVFEDTRTLLYSGWVAPNSDHFNPTITLRPSMNNTGKVVMIAAMIDFKRRAPHINSILEYNLTLAKNASEISWGPLKEQLPPMSTVYSIDASNGNTLYIGGEFSSQNNSHSYQNIVSYEYEKNRMVPLATSGFNGTVSKVLAYNTSKIFVASELNTTTFISQYDPYQRTWTSLKGGVNGPVHTLLLTPNDTLTLSGSFTCQYNNVQCIKSGGIAQWDITLGSWKSQTSLVLGDLKMIDRNWMVGNRLTAETYRADMVALDISGLVRGILNTMSITAGAITMSDEMILAGRMDNGTTQILVSNDKNWTWIDEIQKGEVIALLVHHHQLYVGGQFESNRSISFAAYDLNKDHIKIPVQHVLDDNNSPGLINTIKAYPNENSILIGGNFTKAGSLSCSAMCILDTVTFKWSPVAMGLTGSVYDIIVSESKDIFALGELYVQGHPTSIAVLKDQIWHTYTDMHVLPGTPTQFIEGTDPNMFVITGSSKPSSLLKKRNSSDDTDGFFLGMLQGKVYSELNTHLLGPQTRIHQILFVPAHNVSHYYLEGTPNLLLALGNIELIDIGPVSAALYDGQTWFPYIKSTQWNGQPGQIFKAIHRNDFYNPKNTRRKHKFLMINGIPVGFIFFFVIDYLSLIAVVLISIGMSAGILSILGAFGLFYVLRYRSTVPYKRLVDVFGMVAGVKPLVAQRDKVIQVIQASNPVIYYAKYSFKAQRNGELDLNQGDKVTVTDTTDPIWWLGSKQDEMGNILSGVFPSNYVEA